MEMSKDDKRDEKGKGYAQKVLSIVDEDIREAFLQYEYDSFILGMPLQMQIARSLRQLVSLMREKETGVG